MEIFGLTRAKGNKGFSNSLDLIADNYCIIAKSLELFNAMAAGLAAELAATPKKDYKEF